MNSSFFAETTDTERRNSIIKSFASDDLMKSEDFKSQYVDAEDYEVYTRSSVTEFIKAVDASLSDEAVEDPDQAIAQAEEMIKSLKHIPVETPNGEIVDHYVRKADTKEDTE